MMIDGLKRRFLKVVHPLTTVNLELTNDCNMDCWYCPRKKRPIGYMTMDLFKRLIHEIPESCLVGLSYGGESIVHPQFQEMAEIAHKKFNHLRVNSNGLVKTYPTFIETIVLPKPPSVIFTFDQKFLSQKPDSLLPKYSFCVAPFYSMEILWNGDVTVCCHDVAGIRVLDSVQDRSVLEVWNGEAYKHLRKVGYCEGCELFRYYGK